MDDEDEDLQADQAAAEQEEVFISNEQELTPDKTPFKGLSISPLTVHEVSPLQEASKVQDIEEAKNIEIALSATPSHSFTHEAKEAKEQVSRVQTVPLHRRNTVISVVQDMEHQVEESKLRATKGNFQKVYNV
ncbi:hypothetical protein R1flu_015954 [Riccia fluitans]|uniref:Uncharacterized protein n=1 Tax=Riccia fluitans TaxID=41844 RepID=A0ABD1YKY9_9MARC